MKEPPEKGTKRELAEKAIEAGAGLIPFVGSPLATVFAYMVSWSHNERMKRWLEDLAQAVDEMQETLEKLTDDDVFLDAVVNATRAAQATHQEEKLDALRNGVVHSVGPDAPTIDEQARFFRLIDEFTPFHLRLLAFLDDPGGVFDAAGIARPDLMAGARGPRSARRPQPGRGRDRGLADRSPAHRGVQGAVRVHRQQPARSVARRPGRPRRAGLRAGGAQTDGAGPRQLLETSRPGVFAAGDMRSGSVKRVAAAVGDGALAVRLVHEFVACG